MENKNNDIDPKIESINQEPLTDLQEDKSEAGKRRLQVYGILVFALLILILLGVTFYKNLVTNNEDSELKEDTRHITRVERKTFERQEPKKTLKDFLSPKIQEVKQEVKELVLPTYKPMPPVQTQRVVSNYRPQIIKGGSTALIKNSSGSTAPAYNASSEGNRLSLNELNGNENINTDYVGDAFQPTTASIMKFDPNFLLSKGSYFSCSMNTRLVSDLKGQIACTVSNNVYSANGNILLIEKGSKMLGTYKGSQGSDGSNRIFAIWQEVRTPNGLIIPLFSGATDPLGGSGIEGYTDHKWMLRFGSAVLLSAVDDIFNVLAYNLNGKNDTSSDIDYTENSRENAKDMASIALEQFINIKPTTYKNQGDLVGVYVNRDIDFSKVYKLRRAN
jgi:type IV secretion system protein VirB10